MTEWRVIPGFSRYSVSSDGQVRRDVLMHKSKPGLVPQAIDRDGYVSCSLTGDDGVPRKVQTHRHVAAAFLGPAPDGLIVCHGPAGQLDNSVDNLRYDTYSANTEDARRDGTMLVGSAHPSSRLTEADVVEILVLIVEKVLTHDEIGARFGVTKANISRICSGKSWKHVPRPEGMPPKRYKPAHSKKPPGRPPKAARREHAHV